MRLAVALALMAGVLVAGAASASTLLTRTTITEVNDDGLPIAVGDVFTGSATFDPADLPENGFLPLDEPGRGLFLDFGDFAFQASDAAGFGSGFPAFYTEARRILGLDMSATVPASSILGGLDFEGGVFDRQVVFLNPSTGATVLAGDFEVVPLPGALVLIASGMMALACIRRRPRTGADRPTS